MTLQTPVHRTILRTGTGLITHGNNPVVSLYWSTTTWSYCTWFGFGIVSCPSVCDISLSGFLGPEHFLTKPSLGQWNGSRNGFGSNGRHFILCPTSRRP